MCPMLHVWLNGWTNKPNQTKITFIWPAATGIIALKWPAAACVAATKISAVSYELWFSWCITTSTCK
jgi:hypothetical protein